MLVTWGGRPTEEGNVTEGNLTLVESVELVGIEERDVPKTYWIGKFEVRYGVGVEKLEERENLEIRKSLFSEKYARISFSIDRTRLENYVTSGYIVMDIDDTSFSGYLLVYINGKVVKKISPTLGEISFQFPKDVLSENNILELRATSPGLKFWETNFFRVGKLMIGVNVYGIEEKTTTFDVSNIQIRNFKYAKLEFEVEDYRATADLTIKVNGNIIYSGVPEKFFEKEFELEELGLVEGTNTISFSTGRDGFYEIDDARLTIVHSTKTTKSIEKSFEISHNAYTRLKAGRKGKIKFYIKEVVHPGILRIKIRDSEGRINEIFFQKFSTGMNEVEFSSEDVKEGTNWVIFESPDGAFYIGKIQVEI